MSIWDRCFDKTRGFKLPKEEDAVEAKRKADRGAIASCFSNKKAVNNKVPEAKKKKNPVVVTAKPVTQVVSEEQIYNTTSEEVIAGMQDVFQRKFANLPLFFLFSDFFW